MDTLDFIMAYEGDYLDDDAIIEGFQNLLDTGLVWGLQGSYQRMARYLLDEGLITRKENQDED